MMAWLDERRDVQAVLALILCLATIGFYAAGIEAKTVWDAFLVVITFYFARDTKKPEIDPAEG